MKQRLVGTLVLGCLALIFIPLLLDGEGISPASDIAVIPQEPDLSYTDITPPQLPEPAPAPTTSEAVSSADAEIALPVVTDTLQPGTDTLATEAADSQADTAQTNSSTTAGNAATTTIPRLGSDGLPEVWSIRLGVFGDRSNADALLRKLLAADYKAYSRPMTTAQGALTGIFVGPVLTKAEASTLVGELASKFKVNGIVVQFKVEELQ